MTPIRRWSGLLAKLALAVFGLSVAVLGPGAPRAAAAGYTPVTVTHPAAPQDVCDFLPGGLGALLCHNQVGGAVKKAVGNAVGGVVHKAVGNVATGVGAAVGNSFFNAADSAVRAGDQALLGKIGTLVTKVQTPNLQSAWFLNGFYDRMLGLVLGVILFLMLILRVATSSYRSDWVKEMSQSVLRLVVAVVLMFVIVYLCQLGLFAADKLAAAMTGQKSGTFITLMQQMLKKSSGSIWLDLVTAGLMFLFAFLLWMELIVRSVSMFAGVLFAPLAFSARTMGEWGDRITWRLLTFLGALIFSLPLMVAILGLGVGVSNNVIPDTDASARVMAEAFFLLLAFISPWPLMAWTQHVQATVRGNLQARSEAASAAAAGGRAITSPQQTARQVGTNLGPQSRFGQQLALPGDGRVQTALTRVSSVPGAALAASVVAGPEAGAVMRAIRVEQARRRIQSMRPSPRELPRGQR